MQRVIGVLSGKGGVGKTVTALNLSAALREFGHDSTVIDADISSANLTVHLGLPNAKTSLQDVLIEKGRIYKAVRVVPRGLKIVPASLSLDKSIADMSGLKDLVRGEIEGLTIIDAPPGFSKDVYHVMDACDEIIVVTNPDVPSITDAVKVVEIAKKMGKEVLGIVINRIEKGPSEILASEISALCEVPVIGLIPEDKKMKKAVFERVPIVFHSPHSKAAVHFRHLAANLVDEEYNPPSFLVLRRIFS